VNRYSFRGTKRKRIEGCGGFVPRNKGGSIPRQGEAFWTLFWRTKKNEQIDENRDGQSWGSLLEKRCTERTSAFPCMQTNIEQFFYFVKGEIRDGCGFNFLEKRRNFKQNTTLGPQTAS
jgi:hypothetical protein